mgnify:FL=1
MKRSAVVIGTDRYLDAQITDLRYAGQDAFQVANFLQSVGFETSYLHDKSRGQILRELRKQTAELGPGDLFLLFFSGHGIELQGRHLLLCSEAVHDYLEFMEGALAVDMLKKQSAQTGADRIFIFDTCREPLRKGRGISCEMTPQEARALRNLVPSGEAVSGLPDEPGGLTIVCSCDEGDTAQESEMLSQGLFSSAFIAACRDVLQAQQRVLLDNALMKWLRRRMRNDAARFGLNLAQRPWVLHTGDVPILAGTPVDTPRQTGSTVGGSVSTANGAPAGRLAFLDVVSIPPGAHVSIDGGRWSKDAPFELEKVPWGEHSYRASFDGLRLSARFQVEDFEHKLEVDFTEKLQKREQKQKKQELKAEAEKQWEHCREEDSIESYQAYLSYLDQQGLDCHRQEAEERLEQLGEESKLAISEGSVSNEPAEQDEAGKNDSGTAGRMSAVSEAPSQTRRKNAEGDIFSVDSAKHLNPGDARTLDLGDGVDLELVWCPPGEFMMGSPESDDEAFSSERPQHKVTLQNGFWLGKYPVTQAQWQAVTGENPSLFSDEPDSPQRPVEKVSWKNCRSFVKKLAKATGEKFRLPSEAEWEYACRAGSTGPRYGALDDIAWYGEGLVGATHVVGEKEPNAWGLYDMLGNVWEWCEDNWHDDYEDAPTDGGAWSAGGDSHRVRRGGGWNYFARHCRAAYRYGSEPVNRFSYLGLRLALSPDVAT